MPVSTTVSVGGLLLAAAGAAAALLRVRWTRHRMVRRRQQAQPLREAVQPLLPPSTANHRVARYALGYLQVDALLIEGAERSGCGTRKIGGLFNAQVEIDSWALARELFRRDTIGLRTYVTYTLCRRTWNHLLAGHHDHLAERHVRRCERLVERLNYTLGVPAGTVRERVSARLAAAGIDVAR